MINEERTIIFRTKANRYEDVEISHEIFKGTPLVSVRRFRGDNFTGKGISLRPELFEAILKEVEKAIHSARHVLTSEVGSEEPLDTDGIKRRYDEMLSAISADTSLTQYQKDDKSLEALEWMIDMMEDAA